MRNLAQYPVTAKEIIDYLSEASRRAMAEERCGDMSALLLSSAAKIVAREYALGEGLQSLLTAARASTQEVPDSIIAMIEKLVPAIDDLGIPTD